MKPLAWILSCAILSSCATDHNVSIKKEPCLYPRKDYDFSLCKDFYYDIDGRTDFVPEAFATDLASIPRILWSIYSPNKANTIAGAIIHDYIYFCPGDISRKEADSIFYDALISQGVTKPTAFKYWIAVRVFGESHFNKGAYCTHGYA